MCSEGDDTTELETSPSCSKSSSYGEEGKSEISRDFDGDFGMASVSTSSKQFHLEWCSVEGLIEKYSDLERQGSSSVTWTAVFSDQSRCFWEGSPRNPRLSFLFCNITSFRSVNAKDSTKIIWYNLHPKWHCWYFSYQTCFSVSSTDKTDFPFYTRKVFQNLFGEP